MVRHSVALAAHRARAVMLLDRLDNLASSGDHNHAISAAWAPNRHAPPPHRAAFDFLLEADQRASYSRAASNAKSLRFTRN